MGQGHVASSPLPTTLPKRPNPFVAYIYTPEEFRQLLDATEIFERGKSQMNTVTFHIMLLLLFNSGLRLGEALSLTCEDVNFPERLLDIRDAKYYKNRLVPLNPKVAEKLYDYSNSPFRSSYSKSKHAPFFVKRNGLALTHHCVERSFRKLCIEAGIYRKDGARYQPRLHDIRHTFAVNRLLDWYRKGADVQRLLPYLSTYLGHVNVSATQRYLTMTPELLGEANRRFELYALSGMSHV